MSAEVSLEQRVAALEATVRLLQMQLASRVVDPNWIQKVTGTFKDEPAFEEVLAYGRAIRQADEPAEDARP